MSDGHDLAPFDLKLELLSRGVDPESPALRRMEQARVPITISELVANGIDLYLGEQVLCNVPLVPAGLRLVDEPDGVSLWDGAARIGRALVVPRPAYSLDRAVLAMVEPYACQTVDRVSTWLVTGCRYEAPKAACQFCSLPFDEPYRTHEPQDVVQAVASIVSYPDRHLSVRHVQVTGGTPRAADETLMLRLIEALVSRGLPVQWMLTPPTRVSLLEEGCDLGVTEVALNLELFGEEARRQLMPGKAHLPLRRYEEALTAALDRVGPGRVRSILIVGLEPLEETLRGVEWLAARGVVPVLSPFRPLPQTPLRGRPLPSTTLLREATLRAEEISARYDLRLGCRCIHCQYDVLVSPPDPDDDWFESPLTTDEVAGWVSWWEWTTKRRKAPWGS